MNNHRSLFDIRDAERKSHMEAYSSLQLYAHGSWLSKPVKTVMDILPLLDHISAPCVLDLGCGVGRNAIAIAQHFNACPCRIDCVDILPYAIEKLNENADHYHVTDSIRGIVSSIDDFKIPSDHYDFILAVSALEHVDSVPTFRNKLDEIRLGLHPGGIACFIVNSGITEADTITGESLPPQFEINLTTEEMKATLESTFDGFPIIKSSTVHQHYTVPRDAGIVDIETDVVTLVVQKPLSDHP